jgi:hypothetical protein
MGSTMHVTFTSADSAASFRRLGCLVFAGIALVASGRAQSTISPASKFAYGGNVGWVSFRHDQPVSPAGVTVTEHVLAGFVYAANVGWLNVGDGTPANDVRYSNTSAADWGVNHDGFGGLRGYAYGANIGWVNFGWAAVNDPNAPRINLSSGVFSGFAYSANAGWINLGTGRLATLTIACPDADGDAMADAWEFENFGDTATAGIGTDYDGDGQTDAAEYVAGTNPGKNSDWLRIIEHSVNAATTQMDIRFASTTPARRYRIETRTDLAEMWKDSGLGTFEPDGGGVTSRSIIVEAARARFVRVVGLKPLQ